MHTGKYGGVRRVFEGSHELLRPVTLEGTKLAFTGDTSIETSWDIANVEKTAVAFLVKPSHLHIVIDTPLTTHEIRIGMDDVHSTGGDFVNALTKLQAFYDITRLKPCQNECGGEHSNKTCYHDDNGSCYVEHEKYRMLGPSGYHCECGSKRRRRRLLAKRLLRAEQKLRD